MPKRASLLIIALLFFLNLSQTPAVASTGDLSEKTVLFISSYHNGFDTLPDQIAGLQDVLLPLNIRLDIEFMDSRRFNNSDNLGLFYDLLSYRLQHLPKYDCILLGDDNALQFALDHQEKLFAGIPMVFFCINDIERAGKAWDAPDMTGLIEAISISETLDIARTFNPKANKVVTIVDGTLTGQGDRERFYALADEYPELVLSDLDASEYAFEEMAPALEALDENTIVLYQSLFEDKLGRTKTISQAVEWITEHTHVPVYRASIGGVGSGLIGGKMVPYREHGRIAAGICTEILSGTPVKSIPMITESPNRYIFDYNILKQYSIDMSLVPEDALVLNKPVSFYQANKKIVHISGLILFIFVLITAGAVADNLRRRRTQIQLQEKNDELTSLYEELSAAEEELRQQLDALNEAKRLLEESELRYKIQAYTDQLTGLSNRTALQERLHRIFQEGNASVPPEGFLLLLDLDNFKLVNDIHGHQIGDQILKIMGERLKRLEDNNFFIARIGGDEFILLINRSHTIESIQLIINMIRQVVEEKFIVSDQAFYLTGSIGIARFPDHGVDFLDLYGKADAALYKAKGTGKDRHAFFNQELKESIQYRMSLLTDIRHALEREEFVLYYQPKYNLNLDRITGYEALLRWDKPGYGHISPDRFIPIAEEIGLIDRIGIWVLERACQFSQGINQSSDNLLYVTVNVSAVQLSNPNFETTILDILEKVDIDPTHIGLEITETALMDSFEDNAAKLSRLKSLGLRIYLDDFGTGYSSLNYLKQLPIDVLKIDKSFIDDLAAATREDNLTGDIIRIAHKLGLTVVAEGVETKEQMDILRALSCDLIQGYYISRPVPENQIL